jgi:hypothetical protein
VDTELLLICALTGVINLIGALAWRFFSFLVIPTRAMLGTLRSKQLLWSPFRVFRSNSRSTSVLVIHVLNFP